MTMQDPATQLSRQQKAALSAQLREMSDEQINALYDSFDEAEFASQQLRGSPLWSIVGGVFGLIECEADVRRLISGPGANETREDLFNGEGERAYELSHNGTQEALDNLPENERTGDAEDWTPVGHPTSWDEARELVIAKRLTYNGMEVDRVSGHPHDFITTANGRTYYNIKLHDLDVIEVNEAVS